MYRRRVAQADFGLRELDQLRQHHQRLFEDVVQSFRRRKDYEHDRNSHDVRKFTSSNDETAVVHSPADLSEDTLTTASCFPETQSGPVTSDVFAATTTDDAHYLLPVVMCGRTLNYPSPLHAVMLQFQSVADTAAVAAAAAPNDLLYESLLWQRDTASRSRTNSDRYDDDEDPFSGYYDDASAAGRQHQPGSAIFASVTMATATTDEHLSDCDIWNGSKVVTSSSLERLVDSLTLTDVVQRPASTVSLTSSEGYFSGSESRRYRSRLPSTSSDKNACRKRFCKTIRRLPAQTMTSSQCHDDDLIDIDDIMTSTDCVSQCHG